MGLDTTHNCWHGSYSAFNRWREQVAYLAGLPPLGLMEGFYHPPESGMSVLFCGPGEPLALQKMMRLHRYLPIKWSCLKSEVLKRLLNHSDCDGKIGFVWVGRIADRLEQLFPLVDQLPTSNEGRLEWRQRTEQFIKGLRLAHEKREDVGFH